MDAGLVLVCGCLTRAASPREAGTPHGLAYALGKLALAACWTGDVARAAGMFAAAGSPGTVVGAALPLIYSPEMSG